MAEINAQPSAPQEGNITPAKSELRRGSRAVPRTRRPRVVSVTAIYKI
jgi:hypothetical protein